MYADYFGLTETPFTIAPNPRYLFMSTRHQEALAHLLYGVQEGGGFVQLTGEVGTGKTTLTRALLEQLPENVEVALILNPKMTSQEFVAAICDELNITYERPQTGSVKLLVDALNAYLLQAHADGRRVVLIVDEAQNFQPDVLEQIRLLTNLETTQQKLLQIILVGQPELRDLLARKELRQLAQRITARYHLVPMTYEETKGYIKHRLKVAGAVNEIFSNPAVRLIWLFSHGIPRLVNILADRCLLGAYAAEVRTVSGAIVKQAQSELDAVETRHQPRSTWKWLLPLGVVGIALGVGMGYQLAKQNVVSTIFNTDSVTLSPTPPQPVEPQTSPIHALVEEESKPAEDIIVDDTPSEEPIKENSMLTAGEFKAYLKTSQPSFDLPRALMQLFKRWGNDYQQLAGKTGCEKALTAQKRCFWAEGDWQHFAKLNLPALVWLKSETNTKMKHYFVVHGVDENKVSISVGDEVVTLSPADMQSIWPKRYLVIWQPPSVDFEVIRPGDKGQLIIWLRRNIEQVLNLPPEKQATEPDEYQGELITRVKTFQQRHGLTADGLAGEKTVLHLTSAVAGAQVPLLSRYQDEGM